MIWNESTPSSADEAASARPLTPLAVFAHPDDESFAAGGTLAKYAAEGVEVAIVSTTRGEAGIRGLDAAEASRIREAELRQAAAELGANQVRFLGYRDGTLPADAVGVDVGAHLEAKVRAMQAHASQEPPYPGDPLHEARNLVCHEWFILARSRLPVESERVADLFAGQR